MALPQFSAPPPLKPMYDPRWFIWTIVFLLVSGVSLVSYILITSSTEANAVVEVSTSQLKHKQK